MHTLLSFSSQWTSRCQVDRLCLMSIYKQSIAHGKMAASHILMWAEPSSTFSLAWQSSKDCKLNFECNMTGFFTPFVYWMKHPACWPHPCIITFTATGLKPDELSENFHSFLFSMTSHTCLDKRNINSYKWKQVFKVWVSPRYFLFCFILFITVQNYLLEWIIYDFLNWDPYPTQDIKRDNKFLLNLHLFRSVWMMWFFSTKRTGYRLCIRLKLFFY